jgi:hypothetical protein
MRMIKWLVAGAVAAGGVVLAKATARDVKRYLHMRRM